MSDSPNRGRPYQPSQGQGSYGPPPPYQGPPQRQQPGRQGQAQPPAQQWQQQPQQQQWQQQPQWQQQQQPQQQWQEPQQDQWGQPSYESYEPAYDQYGGSQGGDMPLAPILRRAGARIIDNALVAAFGFALVLPITVGAFGLGKPGSKTEDDGGIWNWPIIFTLFAVLSVLPFIYEAVQLSMWGRTFGKRFMGIGVVQARPAGNQLTTTQAVWRAAITHVGYQIGVFFFLVLAVMVWQYFAYGMLLVWAGALMAYLWAIWDQPLHQALHDRFADTLVIDERAGYGEYAEYAE